MGADRTRKVWSNAERLAAAGDILDASDPWQAFRELRRQYKLQPYQVYAWIGQAALARAAEAKGKAEIRASRVVAKFPDARQRARAEIQNRLEREAEEAATQSQSNDDTIIAAALEVLRRRKGG